MATNPNVRTRSLSLAVQKARAEERKERLEEQWYELEVKNSEREDRKHQLEKTKINVDVLKHYITVVSAIFLILTYFGEELIPALSRASLPFMEESFWEAGIMLLGSLLVVSFLGLAIAIYLPENETAASHVRAIVVATVGGLALLLFFLFSALAVVGQAP